jgi:hypothetical protein
MELPMYRSLAVLLLAACAAPIEGDEIVSPGSDQALGFDWGSDCSEGSGSFVRRLNRNANAAVGTIPAAKRHVTVKLTSASDVDIQLADEATGFEIIAWPNGLLAGDAEECAEYAGARYCYSGYNGGQSDDTLGDEWIRIEGDSNRAVVMRAYGFAAGDATVTYSWHPVPTCNEVGSGRFSQSVQRWNSVPVGVIPAGKVNVTVELAARSRRDLDVQLFDGETILVGWPDGLLSGATEESLEHEQLTIIYSGYDGIDGDLGHERLEIRGELPRDLSLVAFGYESGIADVIYEWGLGAGATCGGIATLECEPGLVCKSWQEGVSDPAGECHGPRWCESDGSAVRDCAGLIHPAALGYWTCPEFTCTYRIGVPPSP